jgi:ribosomal protein L11 methylase PrmA
MSTTELFESCAGGGHATSLLAARAVLACRPESLLDVGTGDGHLMRVARSAGVTRVVGIDREPGSAGTIVDLFEASLDRFDVVVANLPDEVLFRALPRLAGWAQRALVVTGVRLYRAGALARALRRQAMEPGAFAALDGWCCVTSAACRGAGAGG